MQDEMVRSVLYQLNNTMVCFWTNFVGQSRTDSVLYARSRTRGKNSPRNKNNPWLADWVT
jgi:hypothetical protein